MNKLDQLAASDFGFPRAKRIVKTDDFSSVFRLRPVQRTSHFVLYARPTNADEIAHERAQARLGVVVAKKLAARAVTRNMVKRAVREAFRQTTDLPACDYVVRLSSSVNKKNEAAYFAPVLPELQQELKQLFDAKNIARALLKASR